MSVGAAVLRSSARLALEQGDHDSALRYFIASAGLGDRLIDVEVPCLLSGVNALPGYFAWMRLRIFRTSCLAAS